MKYENFDAAKGIKQTIDALMKKLDGLNSPSATVIINSDYERDRLYTIDKGTYHEYQDLASDLIHGIRKSIQAKIESLKNELELL